MPAPLSVIPEDLQLSAATVDVHADTVRARHIAADGRIEAAQRGLPMGSAAALNTAVGKWQADSATLFGRLVGHGCDLRAGATAYLCTDEDSASAVSAVGSTIRPEDMKL